MKTILMRKVEVAVPMICSYCHTTWSEQYQSWQTTYGGYYNETRLQVSHLCPNCNMTAEVRPEKIVLKYIKKPRTERMGLLNWLWSKIKLIQL